MDKFCAIFFLGIVLGGFWLILTCEELNISNDVFLALTLANFRTYSP